MYLVRRCVTIGVAPRQSGLCPPPLPNGGCADELVPLPAVAIVENVFYTGREKGGSIVIRPPSTTDFFEGGLGHQVNVCLQASPTPCVAEVGFAAAPVGPALESDRGGSATRKKRSCGSSSRFERMVVVV